MELQERLKQGDVIIIDGGTGTEMRSCPLRVADSRVEVDIRNIGQKARCQVHERHQEHGAGEQGEIVLQHRIHGQSAEPRPAKHRFCDHRAGDKPGQG